MTDDNNVPPRHVKPNAPHVAIIATVVLVLGGLGAALLAEDERSLQLIIGLVISTVPALVAAAYAERASRDIRNGTVTQKAREGTTRALRDTGMVEATSQAMAMAIVAELLRRNLVDDATTDDELARAVSEVMRQRGVG